MNADLVQKANLLRSLHHGSPPLLLPNAWDVASARAVEEAGFPVVATSSSAVAESLGLSDADSMPPDLVFDVIARVAASVRVPVTADLEAGYQLSSPNLVARIIDSGVVGCNLEDTDHHGPDVLVPIDRQAERIRAVREASVAAGVPLVINARVDVFIREAGGSDGRLAEGIRRGKAYRDAGADCLYPIGLRDSAAIETFVREVEAPVNIWLRAGGPSLQTLSALGVARISLASGLFRRSLNEIKRALAELKGEPLSGQP